jgi:Na+/H+ antiporter NhaA
VLVIAAFYTSDINFYYLAGALSVVIGVAFLGGIGFTMSLFISSLSYVKPIYLDYSKIGIICGSVVCALLGYCILRMSTKPLKTID